MEGSYKNPIDKFLLSQNEEEIRGYHIFLKFLRFCSYDKNLVSTDAIVKSFVPKQ